MFLQANNQPTSEWLGFCQNLPQAGFSTTKHDVLAPLPTAAKTTPRNTGDPPPPEQHEGNQKAAVGGGISENHPSFLRGNLFKGILFKISETELANAFRVRRYPIFFFNPRWGT